MTPSLRRATNPSRPASADTTNADVLRARPGHSEHPAPNRSPTLGPGSTEPLGIAPEPKTAPRPQRCPKPDVSPHRPFLRPGPQRCSPAPNSLRQRRSAAQAESRGEGEQRGGESARPGAELHPRSTAAAPTDFGPGPGADRALKRQRGARGVRGGEGAQSPPVRGWDVRAAVRGEGNPGALRIGVVLCLFYFILFFSLSNSFWKWGMVYIICTYIF